MNSPKLAASFNSKVSMATVTQARERIAASLHLTPVFTCRELDARASSPDFPVEVFCKGEFLQKTGSFKARGALNAVAKLTESADDVVKGVVTHSSGNHGQALAWAARQAGLPCKVVVPKGAPMVKARAIESYGAELIYCEPTPASRAATCQEISDRLGFHVIPPYDHYDVISGQGTIALEFMEQVPDLDCILVPISGGGMTAGICVAAKTARPELKVFAVEPRGKELGASLTAGRRLWGEPKFLDTLADGIKLQQVGHLTWPILLELAEKEVFSVDDGEIVAAMKFVYQRMKLAVEAAAAAGVAALCSQPFKDAARRHGLKRVGVVLCGGNADLEKLPWMS